MLPKLILTLLSFHTRYYHFAIHVVTNTCHVVTKSTFDKSGKMFNGNHFRK